MGPNSSLEMAHRLDPLMGMLFDHMRVRAREDPARLWRDCMHAFDSILLGSQRIKFTPYVVFFAAHITGAGNARKFAADLVARVCDPVCIPSSASLQLFLYFAFLSGVPCGFSSVSSPATHCFPDQLQ